MENDYLEMKSTYIRKDRGGIARGRTGKDKNKKKRSER
jgi:hypothetical protein